MSPTVFCHGRYRFFFFSREESRMHVHIVCSEGEAKYWLEPEIELAKNVKLKRHMLGEIEKVIEERYDDLVEAWKEHFRR